MKQCPVCKTKKKSSEFREKCGPTTITNVICNPCRSEINKKPVNADKLLYGIAQRLL